MSQTLYRKYRPQSFSEVIGQSHVVRTLSNAIKNDRLGQAYLFTGPRGTGKTSIARILAKTINCEKLSDGQPCGKCSACELIKKNTTLDIIEIDAASNTGVDNIRELKETVALPPTALKYKVYIIDEVHMLSKGAFNALLKTLEEPPKHVIFILATTEIHKVPATIVSRCQRFDFGRLPLELIVQKLSTIAQGEKLSVESGVLEMIALSAEGGMRDAESLFGQIIALEDKNVTLKEVEEILGLSDQQTTVQLIENLIADDAHSAIEIVNKLLTDGRDLTVFTKSLLNFLRQMMLLKSNPELKRIFLEETSSEIIDRLEKCALNLSIERIIQAIELFQIAEKQIYSIFLPQLPLEIAILKFIRPNNDSVPPSRPDTLSDKQSSIKKDPVQFVTHVATEKPAKAEMAEKVSDLNLDKVKEKWNAFFEAAQERQLSLKPLLLNCQVKSVEGSRIILATSFDFYKDRLESQAVRLTLEEIFGNLLGLKIFIKAVVDKSLFPDLDEAKNAKEKANEPGIQAPLLASALEIMGGKIVS